MFSLGNNLLLSLHSLDQGCLLLVLLRNISSNLWPFSLYSWQFQRRNFLFPSVKGYNPEPLNPANVLLPRQALPLNILFLMMPVLAVLSQTVSQSGHLMSLSFSGGSTALHFRCVSLIHSELILLSGIKPGSTKLCAWGSPAPPPSTK